MRAKLYRGRWYAVWTEDGQTKRTALRAADRATAERNLADLIRDLARKPLTIDEIVYDYLQERSGKPSVEGMRYAWLQLEPVFGHLRPDQVDRQLCRAYAKRRRSRGIQDGTIIKELSTLRAAINWHDPNNTAVIELPAQPPPRERHLTRDKYRRLREAAKPVHHIWVFITLAYATAGRASAILDLTWNQVDFERGIIRLGNGVRRSKGRATVPMTQAAREALEEARKASVSDYVVEYAGRQVKAIKKGFAAAARRAGIEDVSPHVLRHSAAVHMAESRVPMAEIAQYLGHTRTSVTERVYARFSPDFLRGASRALEDEQRSLEQSHQTEPDDGRKTAG